MNISDHPLYSIWIGIKGRCLHTQNKAYKNYGGRGISVSAEWLDFATFCADMGTRPSLKHSVDRIDNSGNYCKANCRWATQTEQCRNTRHNRRLTLNGVSKTCAEWCEELGINPKTLGIRLHRGYSDKDALEGNNTKRKPQTGGTGIKTPVLCNENGVVYESQHEAARQLGLDVRNLSAVLRGKERSTKGYTFKYFDFEQEMRQAS